MLNPKYTPLGVGCDTGIRRALRLWSRRMSFQNIRDPCQMIRTICYDGFNQPLIGGVARNDVSWCHLLHDLVQEDMQSVIQPFESPTGLTRS